MTVIFTAVPSTPESGIGEGIMITKEMKQTKPIIVPGCYNATVGYLAGRRVVQVVTGEGHATAQMCAFQVLTCSAVVKEIIFFGIAGFSPRVGGVLDPASGCNPPSKPSPSSIVKPGDICVTNLAINWDCQAGPWDQLAGAFPQECSVPGNPNQPFVNANNTVIGGPQGWSCFVNPVPPKGSSELSQTMILGTADAAAVKPTAPVKEWTEWYWGNTSFGMNSSFTPNINASPTVYPPSMCAELDSVFWWSGLPFEIQARYIVAQAVGAKSSLDVIAVSAMEAVGIVAAANNAERLTGISVPYTIVRAASNYVHQPVYRSSSASSSNITTWLQGAEIQEPQGLATNGPAGMDYAIETGSALVIGGLRARCLASGNSKAVCNDEDIKPSSGTRAVFRRDLVVVIIGLVMSILL